MGLHHGACASNVSSGFSAVTGSTKPLQVSQSPRFQHLRVSHVSGRCQGHDVIYFLSRSAALNARSFRDQRCRSSVHLVMSSAPGREVILPAAGMPPRIRFTARLVAPRAQTFGLAPICGSRHQSSRIKQYVRGMYPCLNRKRTSGADIRIRFHKGPHIRRPSALGTLWRCQNQRVPMASVRRGGTLGLLGPAR